MDVPTITQSLILCYKRRNLGVVSPGPKRAVADADILLRIALAEDPVLTTSEIASDLSIGSERVRQRLKPLVEEELVKKKEFGAHAVGYWITDEGRSWLLRQL